MAKQTKTIKCPQCGSIRKKEVGKDIYKCSDCDTAYFLDRDDVIINITERTSYHTSKTPKTPPIQKKTALLTGVFFGLVLVFLIAIPHIFTSHSNNSLFGEDNKPQYGSIKEILLIENPSSNKPIAVVIDDRQNSRFNSPGYYATLYDITAQKVIKEQKISSEVEYFTSFRINKLHDSWYVNEFIYNRDINRVYKLDPVNLVLEDFGEILAGKFTELSAGIAKIEKTNSTDIFELMTNDGFKYAYSSYSNKLYKDRWTVAADKEIPQQTTYFYEFTNKNQIQLVQLQVESQNRILKTHRYNNSYDGKSNIIKDVTPGRRYFMKSSRLNEDDAPKVLYWNDKDLFIRAKASANPTATFNVQSIDIETGNLNWSIETNWDGEVGILDFQEYKDFYTLIVNYDIWNDYHIFKIAKTVSPQLEEIEIHQYRVGGR